MAAVDLLHGLLPDLKIRVVNVVDLMTFAAEITAPARLGRGGFRRAIHRG
jgi:phosphoketolase